MMGETSTATNSGEPDLGLIPRPYCSEDDDDFFVEPVRHGGRNPNLEGCAYAGEYSTKIEGVRQTPPGLDLDDL